MTHSRDSAGSVPAPRPVPAGALAPTASLQTRLKREAKVLVRQRVLTHAQALDLLAAQAGWPSWHALQRAGAATADGSAQHADAPLDLPVDPPLRPGFDFTPHGERPLAEIDTWWERPYAVTMPDGRLCVRCLDGGAWDRSTSYGIAANLSEAAALAQRALAAWRCTSEQPAVVMEGDAVLVVRLNHRPGAQPWQVLHRSPDMADAQRWIEQRYPR